MGCATSLASPPIVDERNVVVTLFCDLAPFTAMGEAADLEDVLTVPADVVGVLASELPQFRGGPPAPLGERRTCAA
jgi:hypothetical protein